MNQTLGDFIPDNIYKQMNINPFFNNHFWKHANDTLDKLVNRTEEQFCSDDVSYAVKVLERYYKAVIELAHENCEDYHMPYLKEDKKYLVDATHGLRTLRNEIVNNFPECFPVLSRSEEKELSQKLLTYQALYVDASYYSFSNYSTFKEIISLIKQERQYMEQFLNSEPFKGKEDYDDI